MMRLAIQKRITFTLLLFLLFSCIGLGLGMIAHISFFNAGHGVTVAAGEEDASHQSHACCSVEVSTAGDVAADHSLYNHHIGKFLIAQKIALVLFLAIFFYGIVRCRQCITRTRFFFYFQRWKRQLLYAALLFARLFSQGILHSKTW